LLDACRSRHCASDLLAADTDGLDGCGAGVAGRLAGDDWLTMPTSRSKSASAARMLHRTHVCL
jgi:hypothetical protein